MPLSKIEHYLREISILERMKERYKAKANDISLKMIEAAVDNAGQAYLSLTDAHKELYAAVQEGQEEWLREEMWQA